MFYVDLKFHLQLFIKCEKFFKEHFKIHLKRKILWLYDYMEEDIVIVSKHIIKIS